MAKPRFYGPIGTILDHGLLIEWLHLFANIYGSSLGWLKNTKNVNSTYMLFILERIKITSHEWGQPCLRHYKFRLARF